MLSDEVNSDLPNESLWSAKKIVVLIFLLMLLSFLPHTARADYSMPLFWIKFTTFSGCRLEPHPIRPPGFVPGPWASYPTCLELGMDVAGVRCSYSGEIISLPGGGSITCYGRYACGLEAVAVRQTADGYICITQDYIVRLSPASGTAESETILTSTEPGQSTNLIARVYDQNNQLIPNVGVQLTLEAKKDSGGHHHGDDTVVARTGTLAGQQVLTGNTEANGLQFSYKAPGVSGDYKIVASCADGKNCTQEGPDTAWVGIKGLEPIIPASDPASGPLYVLIGQDNYHPNNHYLTPQANGRLQQLATLYQQRFPDNPPLHLNDASLERGGLFDIYWENPTKGTKRTTWWTPPHREHRHGTVIDVRANRAPGAIPDRPDVRQYFEQLVLDIQGSFILESQGTSNEHYHIRLMGVAE